MYNIQNEKKMQFGNVSLFAVSKRIFVCTFTKHLYPIQSISKARAAHTSSARLKTREERRTHTIKYCILHGFIAICDTCYALETRKSMLDFGASHRFTFHRTHSHGFIANSREIIILLVFSFHLCCHI